MITLSYKKIHQIRLALVHVVQKMDLISTSFLKSLKRSEIFTHSLKLNKSLLSESLRDSVEDNIACDTEKRRKQENRALKSQIDKMFNGHLALQSKANICGQIVREQSKIICGLEENQRDTI